VTALEVLAGAAETTGFAIALAHLEVGNLLDTPAQGPFVGMIRSGCHQSTQVATQLIVNAFVDVGHRVGERGTMEGTAALSVTRD
jgi:hypothetical protein